VDSLAGSDCADYYDVFLLALEAVDGVDEDVGVGAEGRLQATQLLLVGGDDADREFWAVELLD
jgi:hypothetical protein